MANSLTAEQRRSRWLKEVFDDPVLFAQIRMLRELKGKISTQKIRKYISNMISSHSLPLGFYRALEVFVLDPDYSKMNYWDPRNRTTSFGTELITSYKSVSRLLEGATELVREYEMGRIDKSEHYIFFKIHRSARKSEIIKYIKANYEQADVKKPDIVPASKKELEIFNLFHFQEKRPVQIFKEMENKGYRVQQNNVNRSISQFTKRMNQSESFRIIHREYIFNIKPF